jgi:hypothetical protein
MDVVHPASNYKSEENNCNVEVQEDPALDKDTMIFFLVVVHYKYIVLMKDIYIYMRKDRFTSVHEQVFLV